VPVAQLPLGGVAGLAQVDEREGEVPCPPGPFGVGVPARRLEYRSVPVAEPGRETVSL